MITLLLNTAWSSSVTWNCVLILRFYFVGPPVFLCFLCSQAEPTATLTCTSLMCVTLVKITVPPLFTFVDPSYINRFIALYLIAPALFVCNSNKVTSSTTCAYSDVHNQPNVQVIRYTKWHLRLHYSNDALLKIHRQNDACHVTGTKNLSLRMQYSRKNLYKSLDVTRPLWRWSLFFQLETFLCL